MSCEIKDAVDRLIAAYNALKARCCMTKPWEAIGSPECVVPTILAVFYAVRRAIDNFACGLKAADAHPAPADPAAIACISGAWLEQMIAWISGITCAGPVEPQCWILDNYFPPRSYSGTEPFAPLYGPDVVFGQWTEDAEVYAGTVIEADDALVINDVVYPRSKQPGNHWAAGWVFCVVPAGTELRVNCKDIYRAAIGATGELCVRKAAAP